MKFLHTADWQLGMKAQNLGAVGNVIREQRLSTAKKVIEIANDHHVDFILIAGDVFEDNGVDRILIQKTADILSDFNRGVFIIPGNHDPLVPGSVWDHPVWKSSRNVQIIHEEKSLDLNGGILYPCPVREKHSGKDPTSWIPSDRISGIKIGMAHGTVEGIHQTEPEYPILRDAVQRTGLDYLALGHWHSTALYSATDGLIRMTYSGTHETTKFGERDSGNVLIVEITESGAPPKITPVHSGLLSWEVIAEDIREQGDLSRIREKIEAKENTKSTLIELNLNGLIFADEQQELQRIEEIISSRFLYARTITAQLRPSPEDESWLANLPPGMLRETAQRLRDLADPNSTGNRPKESSPEIASRALLELYSFIGEVSK